MSRRNTVEQDGVKYDTANAATTEAIDYRDRVKSQNAAHNSIFL